MKAFKNGLLFVLAPFLIQATSPDTTEYVTTSPCDQIPRTMLSIPAQSDCEMIRWELVLHRDLRHQSPTGFKLNYTYGMSKPSTTGFIDERKGVKEGQWTQSKETGNKIVYRLAPTGSNLPISFVRLDDNLLHLLDPDGKLMVGHGGWSYTLNRK